MTERAPDRRQRYALANETSLVCLNAIVSNPQIEVGDYTYYHDFADPLGFIMNGGNHRTAGLSTYPFGIFGDGWAKAMPQSWASRGDLVVGHDVWIGYEATLLAGITVGHGAVIGAKSVVATDVPRYAIVAGNPARVRRYRLPPETIDRLLVLAWWDWPIDHITRHVQRIAAGDIDALAAVAPSAPGPGPSAPT